MRWKVGPNPSCPTAPSAASGLGAVLTGFE